MFDLTGKKALVTGGSRGIGQGIALALAKQGADVAINFHSKAQEAEAVVASIKALGRDILATLSLLETSAWMAKESRPKALMEATTTSASWALE